MQFAQKIEDFFFPCSNVVRVFKREHDEAMEEFRGVVKRAQNALTKHGDEAAICIVGDESDECKRKNAASRV